VNRLERVSSEIKHEISLIIQAQVKDPHVGFVTITGVEVSPYIKFAKVYFTVLGDDAQKKASLEALKKASGFIRKQLAIRLNMRYTPALNFKPDQSTEYGSKIDEILKKINDERKKDADTD